MDRFWGGVVLALVLALVRFLYKKLSASKRFPRMAIFVEILAYVIYCLALLLLSVLVIVIFSWPVKPGDGPVRLYAFGIVVLILLNLPNLYFKTKALLARLKKKE